MIEERLIGVVFIFIVGVLVGMSIQYWRERHGKEALRERERRLTDEAIERADNMLREFEENQENPN